MCGRCHGPDAPALAARPPAPTTAGGGELQGVAHEQLRAGAGPAERGAQLDRRRTAATEGAPSPASGRDPLAERGPQGSPHPAAVASAVPGPAGWASAHSVRCDQEVDVGPRLGREGVDRPLTAPAPSPRPRRRAAERWSWSWDYSSTRRRHARSGDPLLSTGVSKEPQPANANEDRSMLLSPPVASWARHSPMAAECLNPWPEQGDATITRGAEGNRSITKRLSGVTV